MLELFNPSAGDFGTADSDSVHTVRVSSSSKNVQPIKAYLPETVSITVASDWGAPFADKAEGGLSNLAGLFGASLKTKALTAQTWQGSTPIEVTIPFILTAQSDPEAEIMAPIRELMKLCLPDIEGGERFIPPGPNFKTYLQSSGGDSDSVVTKIKNLALNASNIGSEGESITVEVGQFMIFKNVVLLSVSPTFNTQRIHHTGKPLKAEVEITFRKYTTSIKTEVDQMLNLAETRLSILDQSGINAKDFFEGVKNKINDKVKSFF